MKIWHALVILFLLSSAGCGGNSSGSGPAPLSGQAVQVGPLSMRVQGKLATSSGGGSTSTITALAGAAITACSIQPPQTLSNTKIAYVSGGGTETIGMQQVPKPASIYLVNSDGSSPSLLYTSSAGLGNISWNSSQSLLCFADSTPAFYTMAPGGTAITPIPNVTSTGTYPSMSGAGLIAYQDSGGHIWTISYNGANNTEISMLSLGTQPNISRDGTRIVLQTGLALSPSLININGTGFSGEQTYNIAPIVNNIVFSADGTKLAFSGFTPSTSTAFIGTTPATINGITTLSSYAALTDNSVLDSEPSFSPDGKWIAFTRKSNMGGTTSIYVVGVDGKNLHQLTQGPSDSWPSWSPFAPTRVLVGSGAPFGTFASGIILGQTGDSVASILAFACMTPSTAQANLIAGGNGQPNSVFQIKGDAIGYLKYMNGTFDSVHSATSLTNGALVSYNNTTGQIDLVIAISPSPSAPGKGIPASTTLTIKGSITGLWDGKGKVLPYKGSAISFNSKTGAFLGTG